MSKKILQTISVIAIFATTGGVVTLFPNYLNAGRERDLLVDVERKKTLLAKTPVWRTERTEGNDGQFRGYRWLKYSNGSWNEGNPFKEYGISDGSYLLYKEHLITDCDEAVAALADYRELKRKYPSPGSPSMTASDIARAEFDGKHGK